MPQIQYPFIDIAVHPAVRTKFAAGEAIAIFSQDMAQVLWANGEGAKLFGYSNIYDLLDNGPDRAGVAFRQLAATARQLETVGDRRGLMMRVSTGFVSQAVSAAVTLVEIRRGEIVVIFSAPVAANSTLDARIAAMLKGFDDPDTHMAVVDDQGAVLASSPGFEALGILPETSRGLIAAIARNDEGLIKRPIASGAGYLPAALGKLSIDPPLNLLFCVETVLGRMDSPHAANEPPAAAPSGEAPAEAVTAGNDAEKDVSLPGIDEESDLPVEGLIETFDQSETDMGVVPAPATLETTADAAPLAEVAEDLPKRAELAADEAETAPTPETDETAAAPQEIPESPELAADKAVAESAPESEYVAEPEDHAEAEMAEAASSEGVDATEETSDEPATELAADQAEIASASETAEQDVAPENVPNSTELAADQAESIADEAGATEPEEHAEADMAEAALNEGEQEEDIADLGLLDGASAADIESHSSAESAQPDQAELPVETTAQPEPAADAEPTEAETTAEPAFQFRRDGRPVRFVWKLDAQGRFSEVSEEFARTVGPHAGDINGMSYRDLDSLFNLDPNDEIGALLERRDTWSGRTIRWPVEGTDLVVPVDLAALPTYSRNREFDGFRGFGIIRVADAEEDPNAVGLTLGAPKGGEPGEATEDHLPDANGEQPPAETPAAEDVHREEHADEPVAIFSEPETILTADLPDEPEEPRDEFRGETPALKLESNPLTSFSEKVVQFEDRRARTREGLTPNEQNAFREIARQLEPFGKRPNEVLLDQQKDDATDEEAPASAEDQPAETTAGPTTAEYPSEPAENAAEEAPQAAEDTEIASLHEDAITDAESEQPPEAGITETHADEETGSDDVGLTASAADQIPLAILIHAGDRLIHANSEFKRFSGYQSLEALEAAGGLDALIARREGPDAGVYAIRADGTEVPVSARLQSVHYEGAKLLMLSLVPADIPASAEDALAEDQETARKLSALKVEADELHSILETATDGVIVLDTDGRIRSMNGSASALFNFEDHETRGKPFAMLFAHESQKAVQDYLNGLAGHGVASVLNDGREVIGREASGGFIPLFMTMGRMPGSNSYCVVIRDITQWKRSEEELKAAKRAAETANQHKSDFLARVSHEIRTPLNAIIGFSDMIASEHFGPAGHPRYVEYANDIGRSGRHVLDIVNDLLDISKIEAGEMDLEFAAVGINDCVSEAVSLVQPQANTQRVIIRTSLSQSVPDVVADLRSVKQIAINILANAIRFTPSGGQIVVSTAYEPTGSVALRIRDTGVGMSKADLEQAMKPFGQVSPGARHRGDGTGLGLPLTKAMTEANRALFSIQSSPNEGTLVEIVFPPQRVLAD